MDRDRRCVVGLRTKEGGQWLVPSIVNLTCNSILKVELSHKGKPTYIIWKLFSHFQQVSCTKVAGNNVKWAEKKQNVVGRNDPQNEEEERMRFDFFLLW